MKRLNEILVSIGLIVWVLVGAVIVYKYGILEKYQIGNSKQVIIVHNSLTGKGWVCGRDGCRNAEQDRKVREDMFKMRQQINEAEMLDLKEETKMILEYAKVKSGNANTIILIDYIMDNLERILANLERGDAP